MTIGDKLPILATAKAAYRLLWTHRALHAKAIWPPIVFLVAAEFMFHKVVGDAQGIGQVLDVLVTAHWYWLAAIAVLWLAGLKFLLSFSISWRRHIMLGEKFDPFYFRWPFWKYLLNLILVYLTCIPVAGVIFLLVGLWGFATDPHDSATRYLTAEGRSGVLSDTIILFGSASIVLLLTLLAIAKLVLSFSAIALGNYKVSWKDSWSKMKRNTISYSVAWVLVMIPVMALTELVSLINHVFDIDVSSTPVALAESAFRQACLFIHFSLGASIGMLTYAKLVQDRGPVEIR